VNSCGHVKNVIGIEVKWIKQEIHVELWKTGPVMDQCLLRTCEGQRTWSPRIQDQSDIIGGTSCGASWVLNIGPFFLHDLIEHKPEEEQ